MAPSNGRAAMRIAAMKIADVMKREVISVRPDSLLAEAGRLMLEHAVSGLPVLDGDGGLVGILSEGDFLRRAEIGTERHRPRWLEFLVGPGVLADQYVRANARTVRDVMTQDVVTVAEDAPLREAADLMTKHRVKRLPVLRGRTLAGIISRSDLLRAASGLMGGLMGGPAEAGPVEPVPDAVIHEHLTAELARQPWAPLDLLAITVQDGIVRLKGSLSDDRQRAALAVAARNVPGVRGVLDELVWVEPLSGCVIEAQAGAPPVAEARTDAGAATAIMDTVLLRPGALREIARAQAAERSTQSREEDRKRKAQEEELHAAFMTRHLQPDAEERFNRQLREAAARGEHEVMVLRFPSDWCTDRGRAINSLSEDWPASLSGFARELHQAYEARLRPLGYRLRAQVLNYPGGMPGEVGLFLGW